MKITQLMATAGITGSESAESSLIGKFTQYKRNYHYNHENLCLSICMNQFVFQYKFDKYEGKCLCPSSIYYNNMANIFPLWLSLILTFFIIGHRCSNVSIASWKKYCLTFANHRFTVQSTLLSPGNPKKKFRLHYSGVYSGSFRIITFTRNVSASCLYRVKSRLIMFVYFKSINFVVLFL